MLWFKPASYEKQDTEGWFWVSPQQQGAAPKANEALWWSAPNELWCPPKKQICISVLLPVWPYFQFKHKITWDYFKNSMIFKFTRLRFQFSKHTHKKERINFIGKKYYFQPSNNFSTFEAEICIWLISLNENPSLKTWQEWLIYWFKSH